MLKILVEGKELDIPSDISFDISLENRLITQADSYSLGIDVPLKDSPANSEIFGMIWRPDADIYSLRYQAQILTDSMALAGIIMIVGVDERNITLQFLEGRSAQNSELSFEDKYINELELGWTHLPASRAITKPADCFRQYGVPTQGKPADCVALPWVIKDSGEIIHNAIAWNKDTSSPDRLIWAYVWRYSDRAAHPPKQENISYMPYLLTVAKTVAQAMGYTCNFRKWEQSEQKDLVVCNTLPASLKLRDWSFPLPHWSVNEFFENIEPILGGEFDIDHADKHIIFNFTDDLLSDIEPVVPENIVDEFSIEVDISDKAKELQSAELSKNIGYEDNSSRFWQMQSCDWFIRRRKNEAVNFDIETRGDGENYHREHLDYIEPVFSKDPTRYFTYKSYDEAKQELYKYRYARTYSGYPYDAIFYIEDIDLHVAFRAIDAFTVTRDILNKLINKDPDIVERLNPVLEDNLYKFSLFPLNEFGDLIHVDDDDAERISLKTVPAPVDKVGDKKYCLFLPYQQDDNLEDQEPLKLDVSDVETIRQPAPIRAIEAGESGRHEYYSNLYIGYWSGGIDVANMIPTTSNVFIFEDFSIYRFPGKNLRLNSGFSRAGAAMSDFDESKIYKFSFISDSIPSPRALYHIKGKKYICRKIEVNFTARGLTRLIKGEFYRLR